jgi:integrase
MASEAARVLGPYQNGKKWRLIIREGAGRKSLVFDTKEHAESVRGSLLAALQSSAGRTIGEAVDEFLAYKAKRFGVSPMTLRYTRHQLSRFLDLQHTLGSVTPQKAEELYLSATERYAAATHHLALRQAKAFFGFCVRQKYIRENPFSEVKSIGKAKAGKPQLRTDEAKKLCDVLLSSAQSGDMRALALMVQVLLGLRSGEVLNLRKRDVDCGGKVLVIEGTKTKNAKRTLELDAPIVRDLLLRRCESLPPEGLLFAPDGATSRLSTTTLWKGLHLYCRRAGVPQVCPHSLRGLHSTLAVKAGATSTYVAQALGHGSDSVTRRHYIEPSALESVRASRVAGTLLGEPDLEGIITTLRSLSSEQLERVAVAVGLRR